MTIADIQAAGDLAGRRLFKIFQAAMFGAAAVAAFGYVQGVDSVLNAGGAIAAASILAMSGILLVLCVAFLVIKAIGASRAPN